TRSAESKLSTIKSWCGADSRSFLARLLPTKPAPPTIRILVLVNSFNSGSPDLVPTRSAGCPACALFHHHADQAVCASLSLRVLRFLLFEVRKGLRNSVFFVPVDRRAHAIFQRCAHLPIESLVSLRRIKQDGIGIVRISGTDLNLAIHRDTKRLDRSVEQFLD